MKAARLSICGIAVILCALFFAGSSFAYWIWTPETKKFINPKYAVKDTPKEQFEWAMTFYDAKDYTRAATEFDKLTKQYEFSEYASKAQYYAGLSYENMGKYYIAFQNYQKAIDNFPHIENLEEIIAREFNIANIYAEKPSPKVMGTDIMTSTDRAVEIYGKVVDNAPFGKLADEAQFRMGEALKKAARYEEATLAFQKVVDDYPSSSFASKAQYEVAYCAYRASLQPAYDAGPTDRAIQIFQEFASSNQDTKLSEEATKTMQRLKDKAAEKSMLTAEFYEKQRHPKSAIIYYQDVLTRYPDSIHAVEAKAKIEELTASASAAPSRGGVFGWIPKRAPSAKKMAAQIAAPSVAQPQEPAQRKKPQGLFGLFGKKQVSKESITAPTPEQSEAFEKTADQLAHQAAMRAMATQNELGSLGPAAVAPDAAAIPVPEPAAMVASAATPAVDQAETEGAAPVAPQQQPAPLARKPAVPDASEQFTNPLAYEDAGASQAEQGTDDPNVELQYDDRI